MKTRHLAFTLLCSFMIVTTTSGQSGSGQEALEAARKTAVIDGKLADAIKQYEVIVKKYEKTDRAVAVQALLRMAECYEKQGSAESQRVYQRVIKEYADQAAAVAEARAKITAQPKAGTPRAFDPIPVDTRLGLLWVPSPDGRFAMDVPIGAGLGLVLHDLAAGTHRVIVKNEPPASVRDFAVWAPDGRRGAFVWRRTGAAPSIEIRSINILTGEVHTVATRPDGSAGGIAVRAWTTKDEIVFTVGQREVFFVSAKGGAPSTRLTLQESVEFGDVVPDGSALLLVDSERLIRRDRATGNEQALTSGFEVSTPRVSLDGKLVAYFAKQSANWSLRIASLTTTPISQSLEIAQTPPAGAMSRRLLRWTSDRLVFDAEVSADTLYGVRLDRDSRPEGPLTRLVHDTWSAGRAVISPDNRRVAYAGGRSLAVMNADGSNERDLVEGPPLPLGWLSADELVFNGSFDEGLFAIHLQTGTIRSIGHDAPVKASAYAPNAQSDTFQYLGMRNEIIVRRFVGDRAVFVARQPGGAERTILEISLGANHLPGRPILRTWAISPSGDRMAYVIPAALGSQDYRLHLRTIGRDDDRSIASVGRPSISWTPDGRRLTYFASNPNGELGIVRLNVETGESMTMLDASHLRGVFPLDSRWVITECSLASDETFLACTALVTATQRSAWGGVTYDAVIARLKRQ